MSWSIRLGNGQHAVRMHSARPRLGFIALGVEQAGGRGICGQQPRNGTKWKVFLYGCKASRELTQENDPGSVWDVDPSLKGPPAVARLVLV